MQAEKLPLAKPTHAKRFFTGSAVFDVARIVTMPKPKVWGWKFKSWVVAQILAVMPPIPCCDWSDAGAGLTVTRPPSRTTVEVKRPPTTVALAGLVTVADEDTAEG